MVADASNQRNGPWIIDNGNLDEPANYEKAISATGYGLFNILLLLAATPVGWSSIFNTTSAAFILPATECVFDLTLFRKGVLVSMVYVGIIAANFIWDFFAQDLVTSRIGRRLVIISGLLVDAICNVSSAFVESYYLFLFLKFISGLMSGGPLALLGTYLSEFHAKSYQPTFAKWSGLLFGLAFIIPAALAFNVLPYHSPFTFTLFKREFSTWQIYLLICSIPSVLSLLTMCLIPESPRHLINTRRTNEALELLKKIYRMNSGKPSKSYPIKALLLPQTLQLMNATDGQNFGAKMHELCIKTKQLFTNPHVASFALMSLLQFGSMLGLNTMRLWVPQLFIMLNNFGRTVRPLYSSNRTLTMCEMLVPKLLPVHDTWKIPCYPSYIESAVYINSTIIATSTVVFGFLVGFVMTTRPRKEIILLTAFLLSTLSCFAVNWAQEVPYMLTLCAVVIVCSKIASTIIAAVNVDVIPLSLRDAANNYMTLIGNLAALIGNLIFSALLGVECIAAFMIIGCIILVCLVFSFFLPKPVEMGTQNDVRKF